ncbi:MAG: hydrogenase maturation nickel metallochaperone HypA [Magnetococcales bacterium]|nr:hydrogenase maturation nickel metallochaperone HypA [Magnetococcales bacterium]
MHEMAIVDGVLSIVTEQARRNGCQRVVGVTLEIGPLSGVSPEAVEFCFEVARRGTLAEGARLTILQPPARGRCRACGGESAISSLIDPCPACGAWGMEALSGEALRVKSLDVE